MARKSIGEGNVKFQVVLPQYIDEAVDILAERSDLSKAQYIRRILRQAVEQQAAYATHTDFKGGDSKHKIHSTTERAVAEDQAAFGKPGATPPVPNPGNTG